MLPFLPKGSERKMRGERLTNDNGVSANHGFCGGSAPSSAPPMCSFNTPSLPSDGGRWELSDLVRLRLNVEQYGLKLSAIENVPISFYEHIMLGGPKRDEQIENMVYTIRNIARAGIPIFGYHWTPSGVWRTTPEQIRYDAVATAFDYERAKSMPLTHGREYTEEEMWENLEHWISASSRRSPRRRASASVSIPATRRCRCWAACRSASATSTPTSG